MITSPEPSAPSVDRAMRPWMYALLALIVIAAAAVRFGMLGGPVYELDEYWHAELSTGRGSLHNHQPVNQIFTPPAAKLTSLENAPPWWKVWSHMEDTVHPPLYLVLLRFWRKLIGEGSAASRSLGAFVSVLSVLLLFDIARRLHGPKVALWAAAIMALASPQIALARTLRGYSTALLWLLCVADLVVSIEQNPLRATRRLIGLFLCTLAALLTHYFTIFVLGAIGIYVLVRLRGRVLGAAVGSMFAAGIVFLVVWGPWMLPQRATLPAATDDWIHDGWDGHVGRVFTWVGSLPLRMLFEPRKAMATIAILGATLYLVPIVFLRKRPDLLLWTLWLWCAMAPLLAMDLIRDTKHLFHIRYTLAAGPAVFALLAALLDHMPKPAMRNVVPAVTALACLLSIGSAYEEPRFEYDELAQYMDQHIQPGEIVVIYSPPDKWYGKAIFLCLSSESRSYPWPTVMLENRPVGAELREKLAKAPGVWLLTENQSLTPGAILGNTQVDRPMYIPHVAVIWHVKVLD